MTDQCLDDVYLVPVPRGLHFVAVSVIERFTAGFHLSVDLVGEPVDCQNNEYTQRLRSQLQKPYGSLYDEFTLQKHVSVGYYEDKIIWSTPGVWEGSVWIKFETNAPVSLVRSIPVLGPLLSCAMVWDLHRLSKLTSNLQDAIHTIQSCVLKNFWFDKAYDLWERHSQHWPNCYKVPNSICYRASCIRAHSNEYSYSREDLLKEIVGIIVPEGKSWRVDLVDYDVEVVLLIISPQCVAVGLSLQPYQLLKTKGFQGNVMPADVSLPYISGKLTSGITRLRPTTSFLLYELAKISQGDIVLDPCCGIGTIPLNVTNGIGIGGDLCLSQDSLAMVAQKYLCGFGRSNPCSNLCAWDASYLPIRSESIDVVVADLPFGKLCLSTNKLNQLLPLWLSELARILRPGFGRAIILCGGIRTLMDALKNTEKTDHVVWSVKSVVPANVGGLLAWVVIVYRTHMPPIVMINQKGRLRKITAARDQMIKRTKAEYLSIE